MQQDNVWCIIKDSLKMTKWEEIKNKIWGQQAVAV